MARDMTIAFFAIPTISYKCQAVQLMGMDVLFPQSNADCLLNNHI